MTEQNSPDNTKEDSGANHQLSLMDRLAGPLTVPVQGARPLMVHPFFSLDSRANQKVIHIHGEHGMEIKVTAAHGCGCPTIWDADLLYYVITRINQALDAGVDPEQARVQEFTVHDFFRATVRDMSGPAYSNFDDSMERLLGARIKTNVEMVEGDEVNGIEGHFTWFDSETLVGWRTLPDGTKRRTKVRVSLGKWLMQQLVANRAVFRLHPDYFHLTSALERRLYSLARGHCGNQPRFEIMLPKLHSKVGGSYTLARFGGFLRKIVDEDPLPEYAIQIVEPDGTGKRRTKRTLDRTKVIFLPREKRRRRSTTFVGRSVHDTKVQMLYPGLCRQLTGRQWGGRFALAKKAIALYAEHNAEAYPVEPGDLAKPENVAKLSELLVDLGMELPH